MGLLTDPKKSMLIRSKPEMTVNNENSSSSQSVAEIPIADDAQELLRPPNYNRISPSQQHHNNHHHQQQQQNSSSLNMEESKLYLLSSIEVKDYLECKLEEAFLKLQHSFGLGLGDHDTTLCVELSQYANRSSVEYEEVCNGLLYVLLTDSSNAPFFLRILFDLSFNLSGVVKNTSSSVSFLHINYII